MTWNHVNLRSANQPSARIGLDYERAEYDANSNKPQSTTVAQNVWANVERAGLGPNDKVRLVLNNVDRFEGNSNSGYQRSTRLTAQSKDLEFAQSGRFTGKLADLLIYAAGYSGVDRCQQKLSVVINGEWQKDPLQPGATFNEFNVDMDAASRR